MNCFSISWTVTIFWKSMMRSFRWIEIKCFNIYLGFSLRSAQICKKCTIWAILRTITQERKKIRQMIPFFSSTFWALTVCHIHFCIWKLPKFIFMGSSFRSFWSANYLNFGGVRCEIRILPRSIQETYALRKGKNQVLLFLSSWKPNLSDLMVYFCLFQKAVLDRIEAKVLKF